MQGKRITIARPHGGIMEFRIRLTATRPDLGALGELLLDIDPAAIFAVDGSGSTLGVSAAIDKAELRELLSQSGIPAALDQITQMPSICCGECGG